MADQIDLLREQFKMLAGEVAFCTSSLKRLIEQSASSPFFIRWRNIIRVVIVCSDNTSSNLSHRRAQVRRLFIAD
jgi:hypothetical protein